MHGKSGRLASQKLLQNIDAGIKKLFCCEAKLRSQSWSLQRNLSQLSRPDHEIQKRSVLKINWGPQCIFEC